MSSPCIKNAAFSVCFLQRSTNTKKGAERFTKRCHKNSTDRSAKLMLFFRKPYPSEIFQEIATFSRASKFEKNSDPSV